ncbi:hypothetical protein WA158_002738 [Blastocystis sp. Blastoise]
MFRKSINFIGDALRETGQALERGGMRVNNDMKFMDTVSRHRPVMKIGTKRPSLNKTCFVAPSAAVVGDVKLAEGTSVWYGSVIRGDENSVTIGKNTNVQDQSVITTEQGPVTIGNNCIIGHNVVLQSCTLEDDCLIGIGSVINNGCHISTHSIVAAGSVVAPNTTVPSGEMWMGKPAKCVRKLHESEMTSFEPHAQEYVKCAELHQQNFPEIAHEFRN